jgi:AcrR family transcriptional regulator
MPDPTDEPATDTEPEENVSWREMAVARSLDSARTRAENRVQRFMGAAMELITTNKGKDFTVQEVVERSGQSLRSFYQHFDGKHELLLALFEESVVSTVAYLGARIGDEADPAERLHKFVIEYHRACRPPSSGQSPPEGVPPAMAEFAQQLLTQHPTEAARAFGPLVTMFRDLLDAAAAAGAVRPNLPSRRVAGVVLEAVMVNVFAATIGGASTRGDDRGAAEELWDLLAHGIVGSPAS